MGKIDLQLGADNAGTIVRRNWVADMIGPSQDEGQGGRAGYVTTTVTLPSIQTATLHVSALGLYRVFINGQRVGDEQLTPGWTNYDDRIAYQSYDVTGLLHGGENRIDIWLGDGWYRSPLLWREHATPNCWGERVGAIAEIVSDDEVICRTGTGWKSGKLPITRSGIYYGEDYDARLESAFDDGDAMVLDFDKTLLVGQETGPVRELEALDPVETWTDKDGRQLYDFGQNTAGYVRIRIRGDAGAKVFVEHSEVLGPDREFDNRNYRGARAALRYTLSGQGEETYAPFFTFMGYRYVRVSVEGPAELVSIQSVPITSVPEMAGGLKCGVPAVERLVLNTIWSQRSNFIEVPTDCPQPDERLGWTGDAQVFAGTACWLADSQRFLRKFLRDVMHDQRPNGAVPHFSPDPTRLHPEGFMFGDSAGSTGWGDVIVILPWQLYLHYGNSEVLAECFPAMLRWLDYLWGISDGPVIRPNAAWHTENFSFGDWLQPTGDSRKPRPTIGDDCAATLYHFISTDLTAKIAGILGEKSHEERLAARAVEIRQAFANEFISPTGRLGHNDQTSYALALLYGVVPEDQIEKTAGYFRRVVEDEGYLIGTGFIGTPALLPALSKVGMSDVAEKVFLNRDVPGWLYQVEQGATTIWERWDAIGPDGTIYEPTMNSYNHYAYGAVCQWLFEDVAGVSPVPEAPGFDKVRIAPTVLPALKNLSIWHDCRHGRIEAGWKVENGKVTYKLSLPDNCHGVIESGEFANLMVGGDTVTADEVLLNPGRHVLEFDLN